MENTFLPLTKRRELIKEIENIKKNLPREEIISRDTKKAENKNNWWSWVSIVITILLVALAIYSNYVKYQADKKFADEANIKEQELLQLRMNSEEARKKAILELLNMLPKDKFAPKSEKQWIYRDTCLVHDYLIKNQYKIAVDTYRNPNDWEIQLFQRPPDSDKYLFDIMVKNSRFLPKPFEDYEVRGNRIIYARFNWDADISIVATSLRELLAQLELYKKENPN